MRQAREIIRLKFSSVSAHEIARRLGMALWRVRKTLRRAESAGLSWPRAESMAEAELEGVLYANRRGRSKLSKSAIGANRRSSLLSFPWIAGMKLLAIPLTRPRSWIAKFTTPIASN